MTDSTHDLGFLAQRATPCLARLGREHPWSGTLALRIGSTRVGVRVDSPATAALLEELLATYREAHLDNVAPPNFSVRLSPEARDERAHPRQATGPRRLNLVYRNHEVVARRDSQAEVLGDLVALLESTTYVAARDHLAIRCSAVVTDRGEVILLPASWYRLLVPHRRRLTTREGLDLLPGDVHLVDVERGDLVRSGAIRDADRWAQRPRSAPVVCWAMLRHTRTPHSLRRSEGVHAAVPTVVNLSAVGPGTVLRGLDRFSTGISFVALPAAAPTAAVAMASALAHSPSLTATAVGGILPPRVSEGERL